METDRDRQHVGDLGNVKCKLLSRDSSHGPGLALETSDWDPRNQT